MSPVVRARSKRSENKKDFMWVGCVFPVCLFLLLLFLYQPEGTLWQASWVPTLDINLSVNLDALSFLFAALILGVGIFIQLYSLAYLRHHEQRFSFHLYLTLFMLAMLGVVLSDNLFLMFVFWELTTFTSYLLIGFNHEQAKSRQSALQSLIVTGCGGLFLLAGLVLLGEIAGSYKISQIIEQADTLSFHPLFNVSLILILFGALTKSAQFPFHFWLPDAMVAPTPVSAYLHSATMVKAGIYLLARFSPIYSDTDIWFYSLVMIGGFTALWSAYLALKQTDMKLMLAYSTNTVLGILTLLLGLGTALATASALLLIMAHGLYKAALFMVVGNIDKATGTRDINQLNGLKSLLMISFIAAALAALSKSGFPPFLGFLSKEYMYKSTLEVEGFITFFLLFINAMIVALTLKVIIKPFFLRPDTKPMQAKPIEVDVKLWFPPLILAIAGIAMPWFGLNWINLNLLIPANHVAHPLSEAFVVKLWQGFNLPLLLSGLTLFVGIILFYWLSFSTLAQRLLSISVPQASLVFQTIMQWMVKLAGWQTQVLQHQKLSGYILVFFTVLVVMTFGSFDMLSTNVWSQVGTLLFYDWLLALSMVAAVITCVLASTWLLSVVALSVIGFLSTLVFVLYSAPDVAKTLLLVETLMVVFIAFLMRHFPSLSDIVAHSKKRKLVHFTISLMLGIAVSSILIAITQIPMNTQLSDFFSEKSVPIGMGRNIVNVILVDFRAFDTLGEALVVVIATLAASTLFSSLLPKRQKEESLIFRTAGHMVAALMLIFSVYLLLRGHNAPGGGFIGALIAVIGLSLLMFAESSQYVLQRLYFSPFNIALVGILTSITAGVAALLSGEPFLTGLWWETGLLVGTPLMFDIGIYLAVIGGVLGLLLKVNQELD